jgi:pimeloyl-ACP methyl ester carboxylesterase
MRRAAVASEWVPGELKRVAFVQARKSRVLATAVVPVVMTTSPRNRNAAAIPRCRFAIVERSAHQSALESPEQVVPLVRDAIAGWTTSEVASSQPTR